jgi:poly(A) polymerase
MHMRIGEYRPEWKDGAVRRLMRDANDDISDLLALAEADRLGANPNASLESLDQLEKRMEAILLNIPVEAMESPLNGREIMELLGIPSGPLVREIKQFLFDEVIEGRLAPRDKDHARRLTLDRYERRPA